MTVLVAGWFSFEGMGATAGDLIARDVVCRWLAEHGCLYEVSTAPPFVGGLDWRVADPGRYEAVIFVCGPFGNGPPVDEFLARFDGRRFIGMNLSMLQDLTEWDPFDLLLERDSSRTARPDLVFLAPPPEVPVIGRIEVHKQSEYRRRALHDGAHARVDQLLATREAAVVSIDTRLDAGTNPLRTPGEIEGLVARMDAVVTTRLHGLVLAIKNGVPALAIDPVAGGAKVQRQAATIGWPMVFTADDLTDEALRDALDYCLSNEAREMARRCRTRAAHLLARVEPQLLAYVAGRS